MPQRKSPSSSPSKSGGPRSPRPGKPSTAKPSRGKPSAGPKTAAARSGSSRPRPPPPAGEEAGQVDRQPEADPLGPDRHDRGHRPVRGGHRHLRGREPQERLDSRRATATRTAARDRGREEHLRRHLHGEPNHNHVRAYSSTTPSPPIGGNHSQYWADCPARSIRTRLRTRTPCTCSSTARSGSPTSQGLARQVDKLKKLVTGVDRMAMSPYPGLKSPISLQVVGLPAVRRLGVRPADRASSSSTALQTQDDA